MGPFFCKFSVLLLCSLLRSSVALFEDQVGKFDWRLQHIGKVTHALYDANQKTKRIIVASEGNVVAALSMTTGGIVWRHVLEESATMLALLDAGPHAITVSSRHVRKWNMERGFLVWEFAHSESQLSSSCCILQGDAVIVVGNSKVQALSLQTGTELWTATAPWQHDDQLVTSSSDDSVFVAALEGQRVSIWTIRDELVSKTPNLIEGVSLRNQRCSSKAKILICLQSTLSGTDVQFVSVEPQSRVSNAFHIQASCSAASIIDGDYVIVQCQNEAHMLKLNVDGLSPKYRIQGTLAVTTNSAGKVMLISAQFGKNAMVTVHNIDDGSAVDTHTEALHTPIQAEPVMVLPYIFTKTDHSSSFRLLVVFEDHAVALIQQSGHVSWMREEGLASLSAVELIDLPVSEVQAKMEEEFGSQSGGLLSMFAGRLMTQAAQMYSFLLHTYHKYVTGLRVIVETEDHVALDEDYLTRDEFNLHKIVLAVSQAGKIFGLDSFTGRIIWTEFMKGSRPFPQGNRFLLFIQRTTSHFPHEPRATVIGMKECAGPDQCPSFALSFNPITGKVDESHILSYNVKHAMILPKMQHDFQRPIVLLDTNNKAHVYPPDSSLPGPHVLYMYTASKQSGRVTGHVITGSGLQDLISFETWSIHFGSTIVAFESKRSKEHVHSLGRVLPDRSVLYKYANPNLVAVVTETEPDTEKGYLEVHLLDAVSGRILFTCDHKRASQPVHMVHSENWIVYTYNNVKYRRPEIAVLELYEGEVQSNSSAFSSLEHRLQRPLVLRQAYILGTGISAIATTLTEKGITGKDVLMARTSGGIVELPKMFLDPRRPLEPTQESREEGVPPYMPELPLSYDGTINYNQSVYRIRTIHTEAAGLESTSLVLAYGLDMFYTMVAPVKMYDVLKDDFDFLFIGAVTFGMIAMSVISRHFALRRMISRAWK